MGGKKKATSTNPASMPGFEWLDSFTSAQVEEAFEAKAKLRLKLRETDPRAETAVSFDDTRANKLAILAYSGALLPAEFGGYVVIDGGVKN